VKIWRNAKALKAAIKDTLKYAKVMYWQIVDLKIVVLISTTSQLSIKIINFVLIKKRGWRKLCTH
jgi:hypothetical protein